MYNKTNAALAALRNSINICLGSWSSWGSQVVNAIVALGGTCPPPPTCSASYSYAAPTSYSHYPLVAPTLLMSYAPDFNTPDATWFLSYIDITPHRPGTPSISDPCS